MLLCILATGFLGILNCHVLQPIDDRDYERTDLIRLKQIQSNAVVSVSRN